MLKDTSDTDKLVYVESADEQLLDLVEEPQHYIEETRVVESPYIYTDGVDNITQDPLIITEVENRTTSTTNKGGHVLYKIPNEMTVRSTYQVIVRISKSTVHIYENLDGEISTTTIPTTQTMGVKLIDSSPSDNKMFDVVENNRGVQLVEDNKEYTQWTWDITPIRSGTSKLKIVISIIKNSVVKETVYEDEVVVRADVTKSVPFFIATYWEWFISSLILPFIIWFYNKRKKKKDE